MLGDPEEELDPETGGLMCRDTGISPLETMMATMVEEQTVVGSRYRRVRKRMQQIVG